MKNWLLTLFLLTLSPSAQYYELYRQWKGQDPAKAIRYAESVLNEPSSTLPDSVRARLCGEVAEWYEFREFRFTEAVDYRRKALAMAPDALPAPRHELALTRLYFKSGQYHLAQRHAIEAENGFRHQKDTTGWMESLNYLGQIYYNCKDYRTAETYFRHLNSLAEQSRDSSMIIRSGNNIAQLPGAPIDTATSRILFREALGYYARHRDSVLYFRMAMSLASINLLSPETPGILRETDSLLSSLRPYLKDIEQQGLFHFTRGNCLLLSGHPEAAARSIDSAVTYYSRGEFDRALKACFQVNYGIYESLGDESRAYACLRDYYRIERKQQSQNIYLDLFRYQNELTLQQEKEAFNQRKNRQWLLLLICFFTLLSAFLLFVIFSQKRSARIRRKEEELVRTQQHQENEKQEIRSQNEQLEIKRTQQFQLDRIVRDQIARLHKLMERTSDNSIRSELERICEELSESRNDENWKDLNQFIPEFNSEFFRRLLADYPNLSVNERRLCALLDANLTTKEIAEITRQNLHSINIARTRLRNKLGLTGSTVTLQEFLSRYH